MIDKQQLSSMLAWHRPFHSNEQIDRFILAAHGITTFGVFKQCLRELDSRWIALRTQLAHLSGPGPVNALDARIAHEGGSKSWEDTAREFVRFYSHAEALYAKLIEDGPLTAERVEALDREEWVQHALRRVALDVIAHGRVARDTLEFVCAFEREARERILTAAQSMAVDVKCAWAVALAEQQVPELPDVEVPIEDIRELVSAELGLIPERIEANGHAPRLRLVSKEIPPVPHPHVTTRLYQEDSAHNGHDLEC